MRSMELVRGTYNMSGTYDLEHSLIKTMIRYNLIDLVKSTDSSVFSCSMTKHIYSYIQTLERIDALQIKHTLMSDHTFLALGGVAFLEMLKLKPYVIESGDKEEITAACRGIIDTLKDSRYRESLTNTLEVSLSLVKDLKTPISNIINKISDSLTRDVATVENFKTMDQVLSSVESYWNVASHDFSTGLSVVDNAFGGGLNKGRLYVFGAPYKRGKSAMLGTISYNLVKKKVNHVYFVLEMSDYTIVSRQIQHYSNKTMEEIKAMSPQDRSELIKKFKEDHDDVVLYLNRQGATLKELDNEVRKLMSLPKECRPEGMIFDYYQKISGGNNSDETQHLDKVAKWLADVAAKYGIFVITAAQTNVKMKEIRDSDDNHYQMESSIAGHTRGGNGLKINCDSYVEIMCDNEHERFWLVPVAMRHDRVGNLGSLQNPSLRLAPKSAFFLDY